MTHTTKQSSISSAAAGAAIYTKRLLSVYDLAVIKVSNQLAWRCPAQLTLSFYNQHLSANHLEVGVGSGYYLDRCRFPCNTPRLVLLDVNPNSLQVSARRLRRYTPTVQLANILEPLQHDLPAFDSIALNYVLHCLPGIMRSKHVVFDNLKPWLKPEGVVFGTTIMGQGQHPNYLARKLMKLYNARGIFSNNEDNLSDLEAILKRSFHNYWTNVVGCVAFFMART
jgi:ubiquinone/menaquinone biosynthesis C-methylase UbiE